MREDIVPQDSAGYKLRGNVTRRETVIDDTGAYRAAAVIR